MKARARLLFDSLTYARLLLCDARVNPQRRRTYGTVIQGISIGVFILWSALALVPAIAHADIFTDILTKNIDFHTVQSDIEGLADPTITIQTQASKWYATSVTLAQDSFGFLLIIELFMMGLQAILFKDNIGEFFASFAFKVFGIGFFLWLINNAQTEFQMIFNSFSQAGKSIAGSGGSLTAYVLSGLGLAAAFFVIGIYGQQMDQSNAESCSEIVGSVQGDVVGDVGGFVFGISPGDGFGFAGGALDGIVKGTVSGNLGCATATPFDHLMYDVICFGLGAMLAFSVAVILLTWALITAESAIVMSAGVFFLGFAGSRFTSPFSQGYLQYAVNVGVKAFTFWLVIAIQNAMFGTLAKDAAAALIANLLTAKLAGLLGVGLGTVVAYAGGAFTLAVAAVAVLECMVMSVMAFSIPAIAGTFISGESSLSATHALTSTIGAFSGASKAVGSFRKAAAARRPAERLANQELNRLRDQTVGKLGSAPGGAPSIFSANTLEPAGGGRRGDSGTTAGAESAAQAMHATPQQEVPGEMPGEADTAAGTATIDGTFDDDGWNEDSANPAFARGQRANGAAQAGSNTIQAADDAEADDAPAATSQRFSNAASQGSNKPRELTQYTPREIREMALTPDGFKNFKILAQRVAAKGMVLSPEQRKAITLASKQALPSGAPAYNLEKLFDAIASEKRNLFHGNRGETTSNAIESIKIGMAGTGDDSTGPAVTLGGSGINN